MATSKKPNKRTLQKYVNEVKRQGNNRQAAAKKLGIPPSTFRNYMDMAEQAGIEMPPAFDTTTMKRSTDIPDSDLHDAWQVYERYGYNKASGAEALGLTTAQFRHRLKKAQERFGYYEKSLGEIHANQPKKQALPKEGSVQRYILTCAQNNTKLHEETWASIMKLAVYYDAEIKVSTFTYAPNDDGSVKRGTNKKGMGHKPEDRWYDPRIQAFISDEYEELAPGLVWCGHYNTLPTTQNPLASKENITGRKSGIFPHARVEMRSIATNQGDATKFNWTTGTVTLRNYLQKNAGIIAEFYHCFGGLLVEVNDQGEWWVRQLSADSDGLIYDLDIWTDGKEVYENEDGLEALVYGDIHERNIDETVRDATWGEGGMVDTLRPKRQVFHDLLDFESRSHHNRRDPHAMYEIYVRGGDKVWDEVRGAGTFLDYCHRSFSEEIIVDSNHDRHFDRYLKEVDWRHDLPNARTILQANEAILDSIEKGERSEFILLEWAWERMGVAQSAFCMNIESEDPDRLSLVVCPDRGGGIELGLHGDIGPNGSRGTGRNLSKLGRKNVIGHSHSPGIFGGTYVAGVTGKLRQGYNVGPSSWAHAHVAVYPNGKRQVLIFWNGKWRAE